MQQNHNFTQRMTKKIILSEQSKGLLLLFVCLCFFAWPSVQILCRIYLSEDDYSHGFLVPFICLYAAYYIWLESRSQKTRGSFLGIAIIIFGVSSIIIGHWYRMALLPGGLGVGFINAIGLILCIYGIFISFFGVNSLGTFFFPLIYLIFAIPFPISVTLPITLRLRHIVSILSEDIIRLLDISVFREGNILYLANAALGIEDACSGIRSFWILMAGSAAIAYFLRIEFKRAIFLCLLTLPISVLMNLIRIILTAVFVTHVSTVYAEGWRHELFGWGTFIGGIILVYGIGFLLSVSQKTPKIVEDEASSKYGNMPELSTIPNFIVGFSVTCFIVGIILNIYIINHYIETDSENLSPRKLLSEFPHQLGHFETALEKSILKEHLDKLNSDDYLVRVYRNGNELIELRIIYWTPSTYVYNQVGSGVNGHIPDRCFPSWGFNQIEEFDSDLTLNGPENYTLSSRLFVKSDKEQAVAFITKNRFVEDYPNSISGKIKTMIQSWNRSFINVSSQYVVTMIAAADHSRNDAQKSLIKFANLVSPILPEFGIK